MTNTWPTTAPTPVAPKPTDPRDTMSQDDLLMKHLQLQEQLSELKAKELDLRKYIVNRAFPAKHEGMNKIDLGEGYQLKASVKYNYKLDSDSNKIWNALDRIGKIGNQGSFIAERLVSWTPNFLLTEYRALQEDNGPEAKQILAIVQEILTITDAAPTLEVKAPKDKKGG